MQRKILITVALLVMVTSSVAAYAWTLTTRIMTTGGSLQVRDYAIQSGGAAVQKVYTTSQNVPVTMLPNAGYMVSKLLINGVSVAVPPVNPWNMGLTAYPTVPSQTFTVYYGQAFIAVTPTVVGTGTVAPTGKQSILAGTTTTFTFTPGLAGGKVYGISGAPAGATYTDATTGVPVAAFPYQGAVNCTFVVPYIPVNLTCSFVPRGAVVSGPQVVVTNVPFTLKSQVTIYDGSDASSLVYLWGQSGPGTASFDSLTNPNATITASVTGDYHFYTTVDNATVSDPIVSNQFAVTVTDSAVPVARTNCNTCHLSYPRSAAAFSPWSSSLHARKAVMCWYCHVGADSGSHPGPALTSPTLLNVCASCHTSFPTTGTPAGHLQKGGSNGCPDCHNPHDLTPSRFLGVQAPHFNNVTTGQYPASYVTSRAVCTDCHSQNNDSKFADQNRHDWAGSLHGSTTNAAFTAYDFKTMDGCVRCHTTTGFRAFSTGRNDKGWGVASDKTKEVVTCRACHNSESDFSLRTLKPYSSATAYPFQVNAGTVVSVAHKNSDYSTSNICMSCHTGTINGDVVKKAMGFGSFTAVSRLANHYYVAGGVLDNNVGFEFDGTPGGIYQDFNKQNDWHSGIGVSTLVDTGNKGPCSGCHQATPGDSHAFQAVYKNMSGAIIGISAQPQCYKCHPSDLGGGIAMTTDVLLSFKTMFTNTLEALKAMLLSKGIDPDNPAYVNWGATQTERTNNAGAFYNYRLLKNSDPGAYVHNPAYTKRLIKYSMDWLDDHSFNNTTYDAISNLGVSNQVKSDAIGYLGVDPNGTPANCFRCHQAYYN